MAALDTARERLALYLECEEAVLVSQSYTIGTRSFTKANLNAVRDGIKYWQDEVDKLELAAKGRKRNPTYRVVPRDL